MSIATQTAQAACLSAVSNIIAQCLAARNAKEPVSIDAAPLVKYIIYGVLNTPLNCLWQEYLERSFPARKDSNRSLVAKFALDQTVGAAGNIIFFSVVHGLLNGHDTAQITNAIVNDSLHIYKSGLVIWPLVSLIGFALLPVQHRVLFGCVIGIAWGVYLNLVAMHE